MRIQKKPARRLTSEEENVFERIFFSIIIPLLISVVATLLIRK